MGRRNVSEGEIVRLLKTPAPDPAQIAQELYERYRQKMYAVAFRILRSEPDAEDAVADAVVRMLRHIDQFTQVEEPAPDMPNRDRNEALLCVYTRHAAIDIVRKRKPDAPLEDAPEQTADTDLPEKTLLAAEEAEALHRTLDCLKPIYREVILLRYAYDMTVGEIASALSLHEVTVRTRLLRGKKMLYTLLSGEREKEVRL